MQHQTENWKKQKKTPPLQKKYDLPRRTTKEMPKKYTKASPLNVLTSRKKFFASLSFRPLQKLFLSNQKEGSIGLGRSSSPTSDYFPTGKFFGWFKTSGGLFDYTVTPLRLMDGDRSIPPIIRLWPRLPFFKSFVRVNFCQEDTLLFSSLFTPPKTNMSPKNGLFQ